MRGELVLCDGSSVCPNPSQARPHVCARLGLSGEWQQVSMEAREFSDPDLDLLLLQQSHHHPLLACLSVASTVKNGFVLTHISRFRQIVGVFTFLATSETGKVSAEMTSLVFWSNGLTTVGDSIQNSVVTDTSTCVCGVYR